MSHLLDQFRFFKKKTGEYADGHGEVRDENRDWENMYRNRWQYDKIVRSTHGVNCTGSCSWKIYVKNGLVTWETQQTDYPRTRPDLPNHEPRGCPRGASYSWYMYSANRVKYPKVRKPLLKLWREAKAKHKNPIDAWESIVTDPSKTEQYKSKRGMGGFVRSSWNEVVEIIAAANIYTAKTFGPDRIIGFSPIPAMSMISYAAGSRYLSLIGGVCLSFYDWYCDLPPASPMIWGEQTDVPEAADWYNSDYIIAWGSNVPQTRTPDAHFFTEVRYKGTKTVAITPDYAEIAKLCDLWLNPKQGTDAALAQAFCHVIIKEFYLKNPSAYFTDYAKRYTDLPMLVMIEKDEKGKRAGRFLRASDLVGNLGQDNNPEWKTIAINSNGELVSPYGAIGYRWGESGRWNLENKEGTNNSEVDLVLSLKGSNESVTIGMDYFGGDEHPYFTAAEGDAIQQKTVPCATLQLADGTSAQVVTVFDLMLANLGVDNGLGGANVTDDYNDASVAGTPAWQEKITGVSREKVIQIAREFAENADKTRGKSMVIIGAGMNHWYHMDMNYRGVINMLMLCGCIGQTGGGWAHYVGQEKLRPQTGWAPLAFALDWHRPPRHMNGTSFFYNHSSQWRHEKVSAHEILSPHANKANFPEHMLDYNVRAERAGWLPSAPQLNMNPLELGRLAKESGKDIETYVVDGLADGSIRFAAESPDNPANFPRNMFIWRSNLLGSSGKGHEYMLRYLLGTKDGVLGEETVHDGIRPNEVDWVENAPTGKLDLVTTLDFRMSSTCLYSDIVLPTATWYEKDDLNTSDMHPFIHPLTAATDPAWESKTDWEIYKLIAKKFSELSEGHLGVETDVVTLPMQHDSEGELAQPFGGTDWKTEGVRPVPGKNCPHIKVVERDYPSTYAKFTSLGVLMDKLGNGSKGITWDTKEEVKLLGELSYTVDEDTVAKGRPRINSAIDAAEAVLMLAPETNGHVAVKAWADLSKTTGRDHTHLAKSSEHEKIRFRDIVAQPRKIISSPTWSGLESEKVSYNAGYTNVHELIPWRTITGRQQFYQDHPWMQAFGEQMQQYRPPIDTRTTEALKRYKDNGNKEIVLNFLTPHQKWGIHSTYSENLLMLTLSRGGPIIWMSEVDAKKAGIEDNDWIEVFNHNGAITARAVVSQRVKEGMTMMYHAQEKLVNIPGSENSGTRGGIHNSVTRAILKPTHMIGGYAQQAYGFNYYGTVGCNRDEFVVVRKMANIDWLEGKPDDSLPQPLPTTLD
ncbi:nitrate reductase subunit alpha [Moraxella caviae]|uniref:nitrate reductase (quinone) n=1 Tax=Moraxella caviae TaxID=34060 RepID=A0A1T0A5S9_9GAMM|nr:nitrate reductase subunit alpha [Moraxella caviae]OOR91096.1 nitrate reductase subunit alpha [Moraxella caviae]STZ14206.1 Respiratory nitrate reductase 1 alpha chain [Moraxella caviae]VEW13444.1 Respiratory nitrate reductase 1 alpha chain [Moraxella caviae]